MNGVRRLLSIVAGVVCAGALAHGLLIGGRNLAVPAPLWSYAGISQRAILSVNHLWSGVHSWSSELDCREASRSKQEAAAHTHLIEVSSVYTDPATGLQKSRRGKSKRLDNAALVDKLGKVQAATCRQSNAHIEDFGRLYLRIVELIAPCLGFGLFLLLGPRQLLVRRKPNLQLWMPFVIVVAALLMGHWGFQAEVARASVVAFAMMATATLLSFRKGREKEIAA
jgi:hypothetical protein